MPSPEPYTVDWFADRADGQWTKMQHAWALDELLYPRSVIDVGCATGNMLLWWARYRPEVHLVGVEKYAVQARWAADPLVERFIVQADVTEPAWWGWFTHYDLALCVEVGEHLERGAENVLVRGLCALSDQVFFTAGRPGQKGDGHINCREPSFWETLFEEQGYGRDLEIIERWRQLIPTDKGKNPRRNAMFFRRISASATQ